MSIDRREFLQSTGALMICFSASACSDDKTSGVSGNVQFGDRLSVDARGFVELLMGKVELGQGIGTALAQIAAEELGVAFERLRLVSVDTNRSPDESYTFSSISIQQSGPRVRSAAARARELLLQDAAQQLGTDVAALTVVDGAIMDGEFAAGINYWQLAAGREQVVQLDVEASPPIGDGYRIIGKSVPRIDLPGKVFGHECFLQDLRLEGMVHARVVRPPAERATLEDFDAAAVESMPGVLKVARDGSFLGVLAEREGQARRAAAALRDLVKWSSPDDLPATDSVHAWLKTAESRVESIVEKGDDAADSPSVIRATYLRQQLAHASISPSAAVALYDNSKLTVWSHAQGMYPLRAAIAHTLGLEIDDIRCIHKEASGCYGHNGADDAACDAAVLAVHSPGRPVRLQWERADEFQWEPFGPAMNIETQAVLDDAGRITDWRHDIWSCPHASRPRGPESAGHLLYARHKQDPLPEPPPYSIPQPAGGSDRNAVPLYDFKNVRVDKHLVTDIPIRGSSLRSLGAYGNVFAIESFMDELAGQSGTDPFEFRLRHLQDPRAVHLLQYLRDLSDWSTRPDSGSGTGWGLGFARFKNLSSYLGVVIRLEVDPVSGSIRLIDAVAVCDAGLIVNPDGAKAQIEGGIVQSASWTLKEEVQVSASRIESRDWASYPILRFDEVPTIEVHLIDRKDQKPLGVGETAQGPTAAAIANAVFHATHKRVRKLPISRSVLQSGEPGT